MRTVNRLRWPQNHRGLGQKQTRILRVISRCVMRTVYLFCGLQIDRGIGRATWGILEGDFAVQCVNRRTIMRTADPAQTCPVPTQIWRTILRCISGTAEAFRCLFCDRKPASEGNFWKIPNLALFLIKGFRGHFRRKIWYFERGKHSRERGRSSKLCHSSIYCHSWEFKEGKTQGLLLTR